MEDENPKLPQQYFTAAVETKMREMSEEAMARHLMDLEQTPFWIAILKYNQARLSQSQSAIFIGDPVKEPTNISRHQGIMLGLSDMQNAVIMLVQQAETDQRNAEAANQDENSGAKK